MLLGIDVDSPLAGDWHGAQLPLVARGKFNVGKVQVAAQFATAPENVEQLLAMLTPGPNGRKTIIYRTNDAKFSAADIRQQFVAGGFDDFVGRHPDVDHYLELGNEPNMAGLELAPHIAMLNDALSLKGQIGHGRLSWLVSLPTTLASATTIIDRFADQFEGIACHLYGDYRLGDGDYQWGDILDYAVASDHGVFITECGINDAATDPAVKAQRILAYGATLPPRVVGLCVFTLGQGTGFPHYELTAAAADVYGARSQGETTMPTMTMVDRATPPSAAEITMLKTNGVTAVAGYVGGVNNGGRAWKPADADRMRAAGFQFLPIYVGENVCPGCKAPVTLTAAQGQKDGTDAIACAQSFGCHDGPLALDIEYGTYTGNVAGALAYMAAWADVVHGAGYLPVQYAITQTASDYHPPIPTGLWIANWDGIGNLANFPNAARFAGIGWQYADNWHGFDVSHVDGGWWNRAVLESAPNPAPESQWFPQTSHYLSHGFLRFWEANGGLPIFGYPLSEEFTGDDGVTVQWLERAQFQYQPKIAGNQWGVTLARLGAASLSDDQAKHPAAFAPAKAPQ